MITQRIIPTRHPYKANKYREGKLKMLEDMGIALTESEMEAFNKLTIQRQIDNFTRQIIKNYRWD